MTLRTVHLAVGVAGLVAFVLSGQYMYWVWNHLDDMADAPRLFYRSSHLYLMWTSALNVALGLFLVQPMNPALRRMQLGASLAIVVGPVLLGASFVLESYEGGIDRQLARWGNVLAFAGISAQLFVAWLTRRTGAAAAQPR
jgi:hypothetical protein